MITYWNKNRTEVVFDLQDEDIQKIYSIIEIMHTEGWKNLQEYLNQVREELIEDAETCTTKRTTKELAAEKCATIRGFSMQKKFLKDLIVASDVFMRDRIRNNENLQDGKEDSNV